MPNEFNLPNDPQIANKIVDAKNEIQKKKIEHGFLGLFWGSAISIPNNIAALSIIVLVLFGIIYSFSVSNVPNEKLLFSIKECWAVVTPIITLAFGYLFGEKTKNSEP